MKLSVQNFRSIKDETFDLAPITVFYGPNGSGKSTVLYSLLTFKNIVLNPNQRVEAFFDYGFLNLGDFRDVVFNHDRRSKIRLKLLEPENNPKAFYEISFSGETAQAEISFDYPLFDKPIGAKTDIYFPYRLTQQVFVETKFRDGDAITLYWNGITFTGSAMRTDIADVHADKIREAGSFAQTELNHVGIVPLKRGFTRPFYSPLPISTSQTTEEDIATFLAIERYFDGKLSGYLEEIAKREFRVNSAGGTGVYSFDLIDRASRVPCNIVNDGFGINQLVHLLAICLQDRHSFVCIEEPEIHLHPSAVRALAQAFIKMTKEEGKRFVIATHSEVFISTLLAEVARGNLKADDLSCYLTTKEGKESKFEKQEVNEKGQISGGLQAFAQAELENTKILLGLSD